VALADTGFLNMFSFPLLRGDASTALIDPYSVVITQSFSRRCFGDKNPMGETILLNNNALNLKVTGILADLPDNTSFGFDVLVPFKRFTHDLSWWSTSGSQGKRATYVELSPGVDAKKISANIRDIIAKHRDSRVVTETYLQHISKWYLYSKVEKGVSVGGRIEMLRMFTLIALMILVIACINFMNLCTAQSSKYAKEVGVRKVIGARRYSLILRFLGESTLIAAIAGVFALYIVLVCLPFFNAIVGEKLNMNLGNGFFWIALPVFILITGILAGSYPAFYLSSFLPVKVLKGIVKVGSGFVTPRKLLIIIQFAIAIVLITSTWVIHRQLHHAQSRNIGYDKSRLVSFEITDRSRHTTELIRRELLETGVAESVSLNFASMCKSESRFTEQIRGAEIVIERNQAESDWAKTTGVQIISGRDIDIRTYPTDSTAMLLNEAAAKLIDFDDPVGEIINLWGRYFHVVGVVKDFVLESPYDPIRPMVITGPATGSINNMIVKLSAHGSLSENLGQMVEIFRKYNPNDVCLYRIVEDVYARRFDKEQRMGSLMTWFAALAVFISCLGLFGLSAYMAESRRKEIGIRKVLGASVSDVIILLSKEFIILVLISVAVASPIAWWAMEKWLANYAYRTNIPWWLFVVVACISLGIALLTVGFQAFKAATENPVKAIKSE